MKGGAGDRKQQVLAEGEETRPRRVNLAEFILRAAEGLGMNRAGPRAHAGPSCPTPAAPLRR